METREQKTYDHFPDETLLEILVKIPAKSIFRFKCVSKNWLSLISEPSFFTRYINSRYDSPPFSLVFQSSNTARAHFFVSTEKNTLKNLISLHDQIPLLKIESTNNDLILYRSENSHQAVFLLANPFTKQFISLPMHSKRRSSGPTGLISNVEDGITSYNVVRVIIKSSLNLEIFSSEKGEWTNFKAVINNCTSKVEFDARPCVAFKGVLHWICNKTRAVLAYDPCGKNYSFCRFISVPNGAYHMNGKNAILGVSGGNLCYFEMSGISIQDYNLPAWKLWVMKDYERGEWSLDRESGERKIDSFGVLCNFLSSYSPLFPVAFHPWNGDVVYFWYEGYILNFSIKTGWFDEDVFLTTFCMLSTWEIFPLLIPLCSSKI
ncbi:hypothetical protein ABFS83_12G099100 [Erythranthe nasuta]